MHMHATPRDGTCQKVLVRKFFFMAQCRQEAGLTEIFAWHNRRLIAFLCFCVFIL